MQFTKDYRIMDDRKIDTFLTAVRTGSFSRAAAELHCTQSAVTQTMNALENELGCHLLERSHRGVTLTEEGKDLLPIFMEADDALARIFSAAAAIRGTEPIHVGSFSSFANSLLPKVISSYEREHPKAPFDISTTTRHLAAWLSSVEIDIAIGHETMLDRFPRTFLMSDRFHAVMPETFWNTKKPETISFDELMEYPYIQARRAAWDVQPLPKGVQVMTVNADDDFTLLSMVAQGLGVTIMPHLSLINVPRGVRIVTLTPLQQRNIVAATLPNPRKDIRIFMTYLKDFLQENEAGV